MRFEKVNEVCYCGVVEWMERKRKTTPVEKEGSMEDRGERREVLEEGRRCTLKFYLK